MLTNVYHPTNDPAVTLTRFQFNNLDRGPEPAPRPTVLVVPGGGYSMCSDREADPIAMPYLAAGFHTFVLRYSLGADAAFPRPLLDIFAAMRFLRAHAEEFALLPDKIAVCGFSAGGHLAATLGTLWNREEFLALGGFKPEEVRPNALILGYPVISTSWIKNSGNLQRLIGDGDAETVTRLLNTQEQVGPHTPPTFLFHTARDTSVPVEDSLIFAAALIHAGVPAELHVYPNGCHGLALATVTTGLVDADVAGWMPLSIAWLTRLFGRPEEAGAPFKKARFTETFTVLPTEQ